jgi:hypothetical protein
VNWLDQCARSSWLAVFVSGMTLASTARAQDQDPPAISEEPSTEVQEEPKDVDGARSDQQEPIDVDVYGKKGEPVEQERPAADTPLGKREIERLPGAFGDAFRAIDSLPGVAPMATGLPHFFIRGATPSASGYFIDGIRVPFLFHLAIGPSVINPAIVDDVSFYPGAYSARYGRHIGGIVEASTREPSRRLRLEGNIRVFDAGALAEVPLLDNKVTVMGAARYSYAGPLLSLVAPDTTLSYWDYQGSAWYHLSSTDRVGLFAFGSHDHLGQIEDGMEEPTELFGVEFHRVHARLERVARPDDQGKMGPWARLGFTFGVDMTGLSDEVVVDARNYQLMNDFDVPLWSWLRFRGGLSLVAEESDVVTNDEEDEDEKFNTKVADSLQSHDAGAAGAYVDVVVSPIDEIDIIPGMRVDLFAEDSATQVGLGPRGALRMRPFPWLMSITAIGLMHQKPTLLVSFPGLDPVGLEDGLQSALQVSQGFELVLPEEITAAVTGFWHDYRDLTDLSATCSVGADTCRATDRTDGKAYGLEFQLRRSLGTRVGGIVSYTLSHSERTYLDDTFTADFDRTHIFNLALGVNLGRGWHVGTRFATYSGRPHSLLKFDNPEEPLEATLIGHRNVLRREPFYRLDARIEKRWVIADQGWVSLILEGFNITGQKELVDFDCRVARVVGSQTGLSCGGQEIGPISIPSIGVSGGI